MLGDGLDEGIDGFGVFAHAGEGVSEAVVGVGEGGAEGESFAVFGGGFGVAGKYLKGLGDVVADFGGSGFDSLELLEDGEGFGGVAVAEENEGGHVESGEVVRIECEDLAADLVGAGEIAGVVVLRGGLEGEGDGGGSEVEHSNASSFLGGNVYVWFNRIDGDISNNSV